MRAIVTGANGFLGSQLIKKLVENNIEVLAIDLSFEESRLPNSPLVSTIEFSLENAIDLVDTIEKGRYDLFYHFAWIGVNGAKKGSLDVQLRNIRISLECAKLAKEIGVKKFLSAGTIAENNIESLAHIQMVSPSMFYGVSKHAARLLLCTFCKSVGLDFVWMQFSNVYGANNNTGNLVSYAFAKLGNNEEALFGPANQPYDFVYIDDLLTAVFLLGIKETPQDFYFIGSGEPMILSEYLTIIGCAFDKMHLVKIGAKSDDGIRYEFKMFDISRTIKDIGNYVKSSFATNIKRMISENPLRKANV